MLKMERSDDLCPMVDLLINEAQEEKVQMEQGGEACIEGGRGDLLEQISTVASQFEDVKERADAWKAGHGGRRESSGSFQAIDDDERMARELAAQFQDEDRAARLVSSSPRAPRDAAGAGSEAVPSSWAGVTSEPSEASGGRKKDKKRKKEKADGHDRGQAGDVFGADPFGSASAAAWPGGGASGMDAFAVSGGLPAASSGNFPASGGFDTAATWPGVADPVGSAPAFHSGDVGSFGEPPPPTGSASLGIFATESAFPKADMGAFGADAGFPKEEAGGSAVDAWGTAHDSAVWGAVPQHSLEPPMEPAAKAFEVGPEEHFPEVQHEHPMFTSRASSVGSFARSETAIMRIGRPYNEIEKDVDRFKEDFIQGLARAAGIDPHRIRIRDIRPG